MQRRLGSTIFVCALLAVVDGAQAQVSTPDQARTLTLMQAAPTDHQRTFDYVKACVAARDYEAAIAALDKLLAFNPGLTRVKYELGVLHMQIVSYQLALQYFEETLADPRIDDGLRRRAEAYILEARKQVAQHRLTGTLFAGLRYNSNAAGVPDSGPIQSRGIDVVPSGPFTGRGDGSAVFLGELTHIYDFKSERAFTWETTGVGYAAALFNESRLSHGLFEISTGPRFAVFDDPHVGITLRPYVVGGSSFIDGSDYVSSVGGGASLNVPLSPFLSVSPSVDGRSVLVRDVSGFGSLGTINTGSLLTAGFGMRWLPAERVTMDGRAYYASNFAEGAGLQSHQTGLGLSVRYDFAPPSESIGLDWSVTTFVRYTNTSFDNPNPVVNPTVARRDDQLRTGLQLDMPVTSSLGMSVLGQYTNNDSNISNFRSDAWSVMAGPTLRF